jgi:hypothetical protein
MTLTFGFLVSSGYSTCLCERAMMEVISWD